MTFPDVCSQRDVVITPCVILGMKKKQHCKYNPTNQDSPARLFLTELKALKGEAASAPSPQVFRDNIRKCETKATCAAVIKVVVTYTDLITVTAFLLVRLFLVLLLRCFSR